MANDLLIRLKAEGGQQAGSAVDDLRKRMKALDDEMNAFNITQKNTAAENAFRNRVKDVRNEVNEMTDDLRIAAKAIDLQADQMDSAAKSAKQLSGALDDVGKSAAKATGTSGKRSMGSIDRQFGQAASGITGIGQAAGFGTQAQAIAAPLRLGGDIADVAENLPLLSAQITAMGASAAAAAVPIGLIAVPLVAIGAGLFFLNNQLKDDEKSIRDLIRAEDDRISSLKNIRQIVESTTAANIQQRQQEISEEIDLRKKASEELTQVTHDTVRDMSEIGRNLTIFKDNVGLGGALDDSNEQLKKNEEIIRDLTKQQEDYNAALAQRQELERLTKIFDDATAAASGYVDSLEERARIELDVQNQLDNATSEGVDNRITELKRSIEQEERIQADLNARLEDLYKARAAATTQAEVNDVAAKIEVLNEASRQTADSLAKQNDELARFEFIIKPVIEAREEELKRINDAAEALARISKAREDELKELTKQRDQHAKDLEKIDADIVKFDLDAAKRRKEVGRSSQLDALNQRLEGAKAQEEAAKNQAKIADINAEYMASELEATKQFQEQESRLTEDYNRDRLRQIDALNAELLDAARANDVVSFLRAQRKGETALRRGAEDFGTDAGRRTGDFLSERTQARDERLAQLAELRVTNDAHVNEVQRIEQQIKDMRARFAQEDLQEEQRANARRIQQLRMNRILVANELSMLDNQVTQAARAIAVNASTSFLGQLAASMRAGATNTNNINVTQNNVVGDVASTRYVREQQAATVDAIANVVGRATVGRLW